MTISELPSRAERQAKIFTHEDFVREFGADYREKCREAFFKRGAIGQDQEMAWLSPNHPDYTHEGSDVNYLVSEEIGNNWLLVAVLPPGSKSSGDHEHPGREKEHPYPVVEKYTCIKGRFDLWIDGRDRILNEGESFDVYPGIAHRVGTNGHWALITILMGNGTLYPRDKRHIRRNLV